MSAAEPLHFRVDVDRERTPISGEVQLEGVAARRFAGWTELFVALEETLADAQHAADPGESRGRHGASAQNAPTGPSGTHRDARPAQILASSLSSTKEGS